MPSRQERTEEYYLSCSIGSNEDLNFGSECPIISAQNTKLRYVNRILRVKNRQGYERFNSTPLHRHGSISYLLNRAVDLFCSGPRLLADSLKRQCRVVAPPIEEPRNSCEELKLSEISESQPSPPPNTMTSGERHRDPFRSEEMVKCQMIMVRDAAYTCVGELGKLNNCQFDDLNAHLNLFQRHFVREVRRCEELERSLRLLEREIVEAEPPIVLPPIDTLHIDVPHQNEMHQLEIKVTELERRVREINMNDERMKKNLNQMVEVQHVLLKVDSFFAEHLEEEAVAEIEAAEHEVDSAPMSAITGHFSFDKSMTSFNGIDDVQLVPLNEGEKKIGEEGAWFVAGVISVEKKVSFERVLWRACRRTAFVRIAEIEDDFVDPVTLVKTRKCVFIVFFKGDSLRKIVDNVCAGYNARQYNCPKTSTERKELLSKTLIQISDMTNIIHATRKHKHKNLTEMSDKLTGWMKKLQIEKAIYHTLNRFTVDTNGFLASECWIPKNELENVKNAMQSAVRHSGNDVQPILNVLETKDVPPTFNRVNKLTRVFQEIVDSYGVAGYREVNPAPYTIISFPFLFAVMFGDLAHGMILLLAAMFLCLNEKAIEKKHVKDEILCTFFNGRYIILLMGFFSLYTGAIYNDAFGKAINIFGSRWRSGYNSTLIDSFMNNEGGKRSIPFVTLDPSTQYIAQNGPYPFGLDPVWNVADNRLSFINSMKMKSSIILGIAHMTFGIILSFKNMRFFHSTVDIVTLFIPQLVFISSIFAYLCIQIILKWIFFSATAGNVLGFEYPGTYCAPSLLIGLINMFMQKNRQYGFLDEEGNEMNNCYLSLWYPHQAVVERILLITAILCVPVMLLGKPLIRLCKRKGGDKEEDYLIGGKEKDVHEESWTDLMVHQGIDTMEFVLGCVSHTASYLRLWALSLAHAQLSEVVWHMVLMGGLSLTDNVFLSPIVAFISFFIFAVLTLAILVVMEGLSAFLHALRLHWVEFQSKFYKGDGYAFHPLSLQQSIHKAQHTYETRDELENDHVTSHLL